MLETQTINHLGKLRLQGMIKSLEEQKKVPDMSQMSFDERFAMVVDSEMLHRNNRQTVRRLKTANLKYPNAIPEDIDWNKKRDLDKKYILNMISCQWISENQNIILCGKTGAGKTWLSCAFCHKACLEGYSVRFFRFPRLFGEINSAKADGTYEKFLLKLAKTNILVLDDWGQKLTSQMRLDLMEIIEDRCETGSIIITSQIPTKNWHEIIGDPSIADSIMDRIIHKSHIFDLKGDSLRKNKAIGKFTKNNHKLLLRVPI